MDASIGIDAKAVVANEKDALKRVAHIHEKIGDSALVEEYVEGREFHVGVIGNRDPVALPAIEIDFSGLPDGMPHVLDRAAKWEPGTAMFEGTKAFVPELPDDLRARIQKTAVEAYRALRVRDYGRVDLRVTPTHDVYVIEVNPSCYLEQSSELAMAARAAGIEYPVLVQQIVEHAMSRVRARPQPA